MNKDIFLIIISFLFTMSCSVETKKGEEKQDINEEIEVYVIEPFLKNTIYIYNDNVSKASLTDYNYTPPQKCWLREITIQIKNNIAIVGTDCKIRHKILSAEYYKVDGIKLAILQTDKGEIRIAEVNTTLGIKYYFDIKYENFRASTGIGAIYCELPKKKHTPIKNNMKNDTLVS